MMLFSAGLPTVRNVPLIGDVNNGRGYACRGRGGGRGGKAYGNSIYSLLNSAVNQTPQKNIVYSKYKCALLFSRSVVSESLGLHGLQHTRLPCPSLSPRVCSNSCSLSL